MKGMELLIHDRDNCRERHVVRDPLREVFWRRTGKPNSPLLKGECGSEQMRERKYQRQFILKNKCRAKRMSECEFACESTK